MFKILANILTGPIVEAVMAIIGQFLKADVDKTKIKADLTTSIGMVFQNVAKSNNEAAQAMFVAFQQTLRTTKVVQIAWFYWVVSQVTFIIWLQFGVPFISWYFDIVYPGVGALDQWAYGGVMGALGLGPIVIKHTMKPPSV